MTLNDPDLQAETLNCDLKNINEWDPPKKKGKLDLMKEKPSN